MVYQDDILADDDDYIILKKFRSFDSYVWKFTIVFIHLYVVWSVCNIIAVFKFRNYYPIRGRAPILTMLQATLFLIILYIPFLAEVLWDIGITKVLHPDKFHW